MKDRFSFIQTVSILSLIFCTAAAAAPAQNVKSLTVTSSAIREGATVSRLYTGDGADKSPPLSWSAGPSSTRSYALTCTDPDAPGGTWWHWIIFNISAQTQQLSENASRADLQTRALGLQGTNDFHKPGYNGPAPPAGKVHHYQFKVMALDTVLSLNADCQKEAFKNALKGHILAEGQLTGVYQR